MLDESGGVPESGVHSSLSLPMLERMEPHDPMIPFKAGDPALPEPSRCGQEELPPPDVFDPVVEALKQHVDRSLLIQNLKLSPEERSMRFERRMALVDKLRLAGCENPRWPVLDMHALQEACNRLRLSEQMPE